MKALMDKYTWLRLSVRIGLVVALGLIGTSCQQDVIEWKTKSNAMVITDYVYNLAEEEKDFIEFGEALRISGIENLLRVRGPFTLLLPDDAAMKDYYVRKGVNSINDLDSATLSTLVYNHIFQGQITSASIGLGTLMYTNGLGDFVASDFVGIDILLNKVAIITKRDISTSNGYVHYIDHVLDPIVESVYDVLSSYEGYDIFIEGLNRTGISDTLKVISFPFGNTSARSRYTILAVPDTLYNRYGISSIDDLIDRYNTDGELTDPNNGFYQYIEYHCLSGTHYFSDLEPDEIYHLISYNNYLNIKVDKEDFKINLRDTVYTGFYYELSNIPAKNGAIHTVNSLLEIEDTELSRVRHQVTDYFDLQQGPYYLNYYQRFYDGENTFKDIKWEGEYMMYYLKPGHGIVDDDAINMNGNFWIEITTPKIRKGKYNFGAYFFYGANAPLSCHVDGEFIGIFDPNLGSWGSMTPLYIGELEFTETVEHTVRLQTVKAGQMFWDFIQFEPVPD